MHTQGPLAQCLVELAGTPDDASDLDDRLVNIVRLVADVVEPVLYASVTMERDAEFTTVATSSELALDIDQAQYADGAGPCLDALRSDQPAAAPQISATMAWPGFRETALRLGLTASLSVPLFAGRGAAIAALNVYSRDQIAMAPLIARIWAVYDPHGSAGGEPPQPLDPGSEQLVAGLDAAFEVRVVIQQAIGVLMQRLRTGEDDAYLQLRLRAAELRTTLPEAASAIVTQYRRS